MYYQEHFAVCQPEYPSWRSKPLGQSRRSRREVVGCSSTLYRLRASFICSSAVGMKRLCSAGSRIRYLSTALGVAADSTIHYHDVSTAQRIGR
eukprot:733209-Rhodomonas_salina.3